MLHSKNDPDALGHSIADTFNLTFEDGLMYLQDKSYPQHLVIWGSSGREVPRYIFAYTMLGRAIHNKKDLLRVTVDCPSRSFPFWELSGDQLEYVKTRLYGDLSFEAAQICMEIFLEVADQAYRDGLIALERLQIFSAICTELPANRKNSFEELAKIIETSIGQCLLWKKGFVSRRDVCALLFNYLYGVSSIEASRINIRHIEDLGGFYKIQIIGEFGYPREVFTGASTYNFIKWWVKSFEGDSLFCSKSDFPACIRCRPSLFEKITHKRLSHICKEVPEIQMFRENFVSKVHEAFNLGLINVQARKLLLGHQGIIPRHVDNLKQREFFVWLESHLGTWQSPLTKA